jgi:hypothetical protein
MDEEYDVWTVIFPLTLAYISSGYCSRHWLDGVRLVRVTVG